MKHFLLCVLGLLVLCVPCSAQWFQAGVRGGAGLTDYHFTPVQIDGVNLRPAAPHPSFEAGFVLRINPLRFLYLQSELNYRWAGYALLATLPAQQYTLRMRSERIEVPVMAGVQVGLFRVFGGAVFGLREQTHNTHHDLFQIDFRSNKPAYLCGVGLSLRRVFIDFRVQGHPGQEPIDVFTVRGISQEIRPRNHTLWTGSVGFYF